MNRRSFIRNALAAIGGVAAGVMIPKSPVEEWTRIVQDPYRDSFIFHNIAWIEDVDCPPDTIYLICRDEFHRQRDRVTMKV